MKTGPRFTFTVRLRADNRMDMGGLLDMLRYDAATVVDWGYDTVGGRPGYVLTLASNRYTPDRWASFGLYTDLK